MVQYFTSFLYVMIFILSKMETPNRYMLECLFGGGQIKFLFLMSCLNTFDVIFQYERELAALVQQLSSTQAKLQEAQQRLASEETCRHQMAVRMSEQLKTSEEDHKQKQSQKDTQMKMIIQR